MTIQVASFGLGALLAVLLLMVVVLAWCVFKLKKLQEDVRGFVPRIDSVDQNLSTNVDHIYREMDSKLDKLESRLKKEK